MIYLGEVGRKSAVVKGESHLLPVMLSRVARAEETDAAVDVVDVDGTLFQAIIVMRIGHSRALWSSEVSGETNLPENPNPLGKWNGIYLRHGSKKGTAGDPWGFPELTSGL